MPSGNKSSRGILRSLRQWPYRRQGLGKGFAPEDLILIDAKDRDILTQAWLHSALHFSSNRIEFSFASDSDFVPSDDVAENIRQFETHAPLAYIYIGDRLPAAIKNALEFLDIPYRTIRPPSNFTTINSEFPDIALPKNHAVLNQRFSVYVHMTGDEYLHDVISAVYETRRTYPDLAVIMPANNVDLTQLNSTLAIAHATDTADKIKSADIILAASEDDIEPWLNVANTMLVAGGQKQDNDLVRTALQAGCAVVLYDHTNERDQSLDELQSSGGLWSVRREGLLGAALTQSLEPERAALTAVQSQSMLLAGSTFIEELDEFLALERG